MILDETLEFCDATSVAYTAQTVLIGDVVDLGADVKDFGMGSPQLWLVMNVDTEIITGGTAGTIAFQLASDAQAAIAIDGSATVHLTTPTFVTDDAAANSAALNAGGTLMAVALPHGTYERYLGILCTVGTTTTTAGAVNAFITAEEPSKILSYPQGSNH